MTGSSGPERRWEDLAGAYALGALDADERAGFEARLRDDQDLRRLVEEYRAAAAGIGSSVAPQEPPVGLRQRVLARAREVAQQEREQERRSGTAMPIRPSGTRRPMGEPPAVGARTSELAPWLLAAALLVVAAGLAIAWSGQRTQVEALTVALDRVQAELGLTRTELAQADSLLGVLQAPDVRMAALSATGADPAMRLFWSPARGRLLIAAANLPPAPQGRTYQLWGISGQDAPVSLGTFDTGPDGTAIVALTPAGAGPFDVSAVTDEPAGGSPQPTTTPFLVGSWATDG